MKAIYFLDPSLFRPVKKTALWLTLFILALFCVETIVVSAEDDAMGALFVVTISSAINPAVAEFVEEAIAKAVAANGACIVIRMDTPGGLAESMRQIVKAMLASRIPVIVYVSPPGARAASAGVMITIAADIAAMAPGTNIGAAHPVGVGGKEANETMAKKITNDIAANARSVAENKGRNADWVEKAVRESIAATETEALEKKVIDLIARDMDDLVAKINGRNVKGKGRLNLDGAKRVIISEDLRTRILKIISDPNIAYILMMIGLAGIYFELSHPGAIFPGVVGGISLILAFFALQTLPVNYAGMLLIILAIILFVMELKLTSYGLLSFGGIVSLAMGSLMLFDTTEAAMRISWQVLLPTLAFISTFFVLIAALVFRAQKSQAKTGEEGLIGEIGVVEMRIDPVGKVFIHGELWQAQANRTIEKGRKVEVTGVQNLVLAVKPVSKDEVSR